MSCDPIDPPHVLNACLALTPVFAGTLQAAYVLSDYDPVAPGPQTDIHPSDKGCEKIAATFAELIADLGLL